MNLTTSGRLEDKPQTSNNGGGEAAVIASLAVDVSSFVEHIGLIAYNHQAADIAMHRDGDVMSVSGPVQVRRHKGEHGNERATMRIVVYAFVPALPAESAA